MENKWIVLSNWIKTNSDKAIPASLARKIVGKEAFNAFKASGHIVQGGRLGKNAKAVVRLGPEALAECENEELYTIFAKFPEGFVEEVDVKASNARQAEERAKVILEEGYKPGWKIVRIAHRSRGVLFV